jgi:hypothetical protein
MDPTLAMPGQMQAAANTDPNVALQNALMLQAIKGGASGGGAPPAGATSAAMGPPPAGMMAPPPMQPVDPASMTGGLGAQPSASGPSPAMMAQMQAMASQPQANPVASALMSPIPGGQ